jgi:hypothetical protein
MIMITSYNDRLETKDKEIKAIAKVLDDQKVGLTK